MALVMNDLNTAPQEDLKHRMARYLLGEIFGYDKEGNMNTPNYNPDNILNNANAAIAGGTPEDVAKAAAQQAMREGSIVKPFYSDGDLNLADKIGIGDWAKLTGTAAKAHPFKTMGLIGSAAGNIGGLTDNDKFGGQLAGLGLGGLGAYALAQGNPYMAAMMTMGGGNLGALFDKLRARKEQEQSQPYYGDR